MLNYLDYMQQHGHQELTFCTDEDSGLTAIIALHKTTLGAGLGGTRLWHYDNPNDAILDVLRLSEGMTYKAAVASLPLGGGKAVILADGQESKPDIRAARFRAFGKYINGLGGRYITAEDVGTKPQDMHEIRKMTPYVVGLSHEEGGSGDPSPMTAFGVMHGIRAMVEEVLGKSDLNGIRVNIQGLGKVGMALAQYLLDAHAIVVGSDINLQRMHMAEEKLHIQTVKPGVIFDVPGDVFAPCALGAVLNDNTIPRLRCKIVAGAANNQLAETRHGNVLHEYEIIYAVDYVINAGGLINVAAELAGGYDESKARSQTANIYNTIKEMMFLAKEENITTDMAARMMAQFALQKGKPVLEKAAA